MVARCCARLALLTLLVLFAARGHIGEPRRTSPGFLSAFLREGVALTPDRPASPWAVTLSAARYGCAGDLRALAPVEPEVHGDRVEYRREGIVEWYAGGPRGLEQGFTLATPPPCEGPLAIEMDVRGLEPRLTSGSAAELRDPRGGSVLRYAELEVRDADGRAIPARLDAVSSHLGIHVDATGARYPLVIDPLITTENAKLVATQKTSGDGLGQAVAISGDTVVVGAPQHPNFHGPGAAFVFVRSGAVWTQQAMLTASNGVNDDQFGTAVAISGDTVVVGAYAHNLDTGAAYVFVRNGTTWTQQQILSGSSQSQSDWFGTSVAISGDTVVVGASHDAAPGLPSGGSATVFVRSGTTWTQQQILTAADGVTNDLFGYAVALSGDTALVGAPSKSAGGKSAVGAAYVYVRSGTTWTQEQKLTASDGVALDFFGQTLDVNVDTAVVGALSASPGGIASAGAAYVMVRSGSTWTEQQKLTASDKMANDFFGSFVGVWGDTAVIGASQHTVGAAMQGGAAYVFGRSGVAWSEQKQLAASDEAASDYFAHGGAVSAGTAVVGAYNHSPGGTFGAGEAYVYVLGAAAANGTPCTAGADCASGFCADGVCCNTACAAGACDACSIAAGATANGTCTLLTGPACDDGDACTQADTCQAGICKGANPVTCTAQDECHDAGTCDPSSGMCSSPAKPDGAACTGGSCIAGVCTPMGGTGGSGGSGGSGGATTSTASTTSTGGATTSATSAGGGGGTTASTTGTGGGSPVENSGCGCATPGSGANDVLGAALAALALVLVARRRRW